MIDVANLVVARSGRTILDVPEWHVALGQTALVLGPSGSGKTTLLHVLAGLLTPTSGHVRIADTDLRTLSETARDTFRGRRIGIVFQGARLVQALSLRDNLRLAAGLSGSVVDLVRIDELIERLQLAHRAHALARHLSTGEQQRAALARAMVARPNLILADEPTSALDDANAERVADLLVEEAAACGASLVIATHDRRLMERFAVSLRLDAPGSNVQTGIQPGPQVPA